MTRFPTSRPRILRPDLAVCIRAMAGLALVVGSVTLAASRPLEAQQPTKPVAPPITPPDSVRRDTAATAPKHRGVSPKGAFLRAMAIPGWGHSAIGAYKRGAFYFVVEGMTAWELIRTGQRIKEAQNLATFREGVVRGDLSAMGITDLAEVQDSLNADAKLSDLDSLVSSRKSQKEDWTALGIFLVFLSGADAYVSAHLQHFPVPLTLEAQPAGGGRMDLALSVKLPRRGFTRPSASGTEANPPPAPGTSGSGPSHRR